MLSVQDITKSYEGKPLLKGISFEVHEGETVCLLGRREAENPPFYG